MLEEKKKEQLRFAHCEKCNGLGYLGTDLKGDALRVCSTCKGLPVKAVSQGDFLFWGKRIDTLNILQNKAERIVQGVINGLLVVFGVLGVVALLWEIYLASQEAFVFSEFIRQTSFWRLIFWVSIGTDMYAYYRMDQELTPKVSVKKREFGTKAPLLRKKGEKIDIAKTFTQEAHEALEKAWLLTQKLKHKEVRPVHLLVSLLNYSQVMAVVARLGIGKTELTSKLKRVVTRQERSGSPPFFSRDLNRLLYFAYEEAADTRQDQVDLTELLVSLLKSQDEHLTKTLLYDLDVDLRKLRNVVAWINISKTLRKQWRRWRGKAAQKPKGTMNRAMTARPTYLLDSLGDDLTLMAKAGALFPLIDRENELAEIIRILERPAGNVLVIGDAGVGKSTIVEGLAQLMASEEVPEILQDKRLASLNSGALVAGSGRGDVEGRLMTVINEIIKAGNVVLFIDDLANLAGAGTGGPAGSLDATDILAQALTKGSIKVIATSTRTDFRRFLQNNEAFIRRFQVVRLEEVDRDGAIQILEGKAGAIEYRQKVFFSYSAIEKAVTLSDKFIHDRYLPAKAINIIEEAAVMVKKTRGERSVVTGEDVAQIISDKTKVRVTKITEAESVKLMKIEDEIHKRLVDQDEAVKAVSSALKRARTELRDEEHTIANLLFLGPTGVGKTELAKQVARVYFSSSENMIRLDMSEYQDIASINRLIGAPAGYQGAGGGILTEAVRNSPFALLLLDELEKAHPDILNIFLQVMDDGRITDATGRTIDFRNVILIATSNAGTGLIQEGLRQGRSIEVIKQELLDNALKPYFRPEFLNRFDGIIVFKPLSPADVEQIAVLLIDELAEQMEKKGITLKATPEAVKELAQEGFDPTMGARPLKRVVQDRVNDALANFLLAGKLGRRDVAILEPGGVIRVEKAEEI